MLRHFYLAETGERFTAEIPGEPLDGNLIHFDGDLPYVTSKSKLWRVYRTVHSSKWTEFWLETASPYISDLLYRGEKNEA